MTLLPIPFNNPATYAGHSGVDFPQPRGTPFRASWPGVVTSIDYGPRPGHTVWVRYDTGVLVGYCHMDARTTHVRVGQRVTEGTILGLVGSLGTFSTGPHLHCEIAGHATTAGFWRFFTASRVVGDGQPAGGNERPIPEPDPITPLELEDMNPVYVDDKGTVYALDTVTGKRRRLSTAEWRSVRRAYVAAGRPVPLGAWNDSLAGL